MLHRIMKRVQEIEGFKELPKPCEYFHIMGGTSTGGYVLRISLVWGSVSLGLTFLVPIDWSPSCSAGYV